jgi:CRISPR-associated protein Csb2
VPEVISGHLPDGSVSERPHLAFVPLPNVGGGSHSDGALIGLALVLPRAATPDERRAVLEAVERWEAAQPLEGDDRPSVPVFLGRAGEWRVVRLDEEAAQSTLRPRTWCRPARRWASATPVALDRHPGDLWSGADAKRDRAFAEAEETVAAACGHIGLPRPRVTILPAAPLVGGAKARAFAPFPGPGRPPRVLTHALLEFDEPVHGPILLGAGRYAGLGLFRPAGEDR